MPESQARGNADGLHAWEDDVLRRYPKPDNGGEQKEKPAFRDYEAETRPSVKEFYRLNHTHQTLEFVKAKHAELLRFDKRKMSVWEALEYLNTLVDDSDPDTDLPQIEHCLQTAEAIRADGHPRWFILTGLVHDLGKILCLFGEPQWAVVGDTFPVGCAFSDSIVYSEFFAENPDSLVPAYKTPCGIYRRGCGLSAVYLSWGHDEYMYHIAKDHLPEEAQYMIRYHSFYPGHRENGYNHLMNDHDREMFEWVRRFNTYDLYSKSEAPPDVDGLRPYYNELIGEFFPATLAW